MRQNPIAPPLRPQEPQPLTSHKLRFSIGAQVVAIHCLVIFGPLGYVLYRNWLTPQESAFKVKLVGPLSTGEEVGPPSRLRPSPNPGPPEPPAPNRRLRSRRNPCRRPRNRPSRRRSRNRR